MYGLEEGKQKPIFEFDLEKEIKEDPERAQTLLKSVETHIQEIKGVLREGGEAKDIDNYGVLLHGYTALQKVLTKVTTR